MKYVYINTNKILPVSPRMVNRKSSYIYANDEEETTVREFKDLVREEKPEYDEKTQELFSWFEDGKVITQKYKVINKVTGLSED